MRTGPAILEMQNVTKVYGSGDTAVTALESVNFRANAGEVVLIMGPSGAGKTTFLTIAGALLRPTSGTVLLSGADLTQMSEGDLPDLRREKIGFVFQNFNLLEALTATENVTLVMSQARGGSPHRARELLHMLGLDHRLKSLPKNLSGGEKQRVAIARALANNPALLLADEPTGALDSKTGAEVLDLFGELHSQGNTVILVTHDPHIASLAQRQVELYDGVIRQAEAA
jgi:putative ABC transport system ATP-binding protein